MKKVLLTGGGSAGHVTPNLSIIEQLQSQGFECVYIGQANGFEQKIINQSFPDLKFIGITTGKLRRYWSFQNFIDIFKIIIAFFQSFYHVLKIKPDYLFSKGGFVAPPVVLACFLLRVPIFIHESDSSPGLATKLSLPFANKIFVSSASALKYFSTHKNIHLVQMPIRAFLYKGNPDSIKFQDDTKKTLLIMGGSLGAKTLNDFLLQNFQSLTKTLNIIHLTGETHYSDMPENSESYLKYGFVQKEIADIYAKADLVLCRAGATTLAEISELHIPAILVPLPLSQSRGEQIDNAKDYQKNYGSQIISDENLSLKTFEESLKNLQKTSKTSKVKQLPSLISFFSESI